MTTAGYGLAKVQNIPYAMWKQIRDIRTNDELADFLKQDEHYFREFLLKRTSAGKVDALLREGRVKDASEFDYLCESLKSCLFRAGGSNIMKWGLWIPGSDDITAIKDVIDDNEFYRITLPERLYQDIAMVSARIHERILESADGAKVLTRVDYVIRDDGTASIIDVGESNTSMGLADRLHKMMGFGEGRLLDGYIDRVLRVHERINPGFKRVLFVAEDERMIKNLDYEFMMMKGSCSKAGVSSDTITLDDFQANGMGQNNAALIRCFRGFHRVIISGMVDSTMFIDVYNKENLHRIISSMDLPGLVSLPKARSFSLKGCPEAIADEMAGYVSDAGFVDYVVKPSVKSKRNSSLAYIYNNNNPVHRRQLIRNLKRFINEGHIQSMMLEENIASSAADGRKLEVRIHCFTD